MSDDAADAGSGGAAHGGEDGGSGSTRSATVTRTACIATQSEDMPESESADASTDTGDLARLAWRDNWLYAASLGVALAVAVGLYARRGPR